jgi:hypothetical protein
MGIIGESTCPLMPIQWMHDGCDKLDMILEALRKDIELNKLEVENYIDQLCCGLLALLSEQSRTHVML